MKIQILMKVYTYLFHSQTFIFSYFKYNLEILFYKSAIENLKILYIILPNYKKNLYKSKCILINNNTEFKSNISLYILLLLLIPNFFITHSTSNSSNIYYPATINSSILSNTIKNFLS